MECLTSVPFFQGSAIAYLGSFHWKMNEMFKKYPMATLVEDMFFYVDPEVVTEYTSVVDVLKLSAAWKRAGSGPFREAVKFTA